MASMKFAAPALLALALTLAACGDGGEAPAAGPEAADAADTADAAPEGGADTAASGDYFVDESGALDPAIRTEAEATLDAYHASTGRDVYVVTIMSTDGADIEAEAERMRTERGADALILVAGTDHRLAIVGVNAAASQSAEESMTNALDNGMIREAFEMGIGLVTDALGH